MAHINGSEDVAISNVPGVHNYDYDTNTSEWLAKVWSSGGEVGAGSTQVTVSNFVAPSTQVSVSGYSTVVTVSGYVAPSTTVTVSGYVAPSTDVSVSNLSTNVSVSTGSVRVHQSTAADLNVTVAGYVAPSTTVTVSGYVAPSTQVSVSGYSTVVTVSGYVAPSTTVTVSGYVAPSTITAVSSLAGKVTVAQLSTTWEVQLPGLTSTSAPSTGALGLVVRPIVNGINSYAASTTGQSSLTTILSSAAASKAFVFAYSIMTTLAGPVQGGFYDGATLKWPFVVAAVSSAISGCNLAVSPPGFLFRTSTGSAFDFHVDSSNRGLNVGIAYWVST